VRPIDSLTEPSWLLMIMMMINAPRKP